MSEQLGTNWRELCELNESTLRCAMVQIEQLRAALTEAKEALESVSSGAEYECGTTYEISTWRIEKVDAALAKIREVMP